MPPLHKITLQTLFLLLTAKPVALTLSLLIIYHLHSLVAISSFYAVALAGICTAYSLRWHHRPQSPQNNTVK